jgi:hypothetical protein
VCGEYLEFRELISTDAAAAATTAMQGEQQNILEEHAETEQAIQHVIDKATRKTYLEALTVNTVEQVNQNRVATQQWEGGNEQAPTYTPVSKQQDLVNVLVNSIENQRNRQ